MFSIFEGSPLKDSDKYQKPDSDTNFSKNLGLYTNNSKTLIMNHPLFIMATRNRYKLMAHPWCKSLVHKKLFGISLILFLLLFGLYASFLGLFTTMVVRTRHPQEYYAQTSIPFDSQLCRNVSLALNTTGIKQTSDVAVRNAMYALFTLLVIFLRDDCSWM